MLLDLRKNTGNLPVSGQSIEDNAQLAAEVDHHRQAGLLPRGASPLQREGKLSQATRHRTSKYRNNILEVDHGGIKRVIPPTRGFQTMKTAYATIKGFEVTRMIRRRHYVLCKPKITGGIQFINKLFDIAA
jgi:hypothetical protein